MNQQTAPADEQEWNLSARIANWARFTADRGWLSYTGRCRSIEGRYQLDPNDPIRRDEEIDRRTPKMTQADIDAHLADAWEVEDAWKELPDLFRFCLKFVYLKRWDSRKVWYKLGPYRSLQLRMRNYDELLRLARFALANQLRRRNS
jgi:hypothetical protein